MSGAPKSAQTTVSHSSSCPSINSRTSTQNPARNRIPGAVANLPLTSPSHNSDDDLSDAPENPVFPTFPKSWNLRPAVPPSDSDSDLSDAPDSPVWPGSPKAPPTPPRCTEKDCPVKKATRRHNQGPYLHGGKPPRTKETIFSDSNPPPHVWESLKKLQAKDRSSTVEDDWNVLGFLRWHVDNPNTSLMGI